MRTPAQRNLYPFATVDKLPDLSPDARRLFDRVVSVVRPDASSIVGAECWANIFNEGDGIPMHSDIDEILYRETRQLRCALFGAVYYGRCENLEGGSLIFEDGVVVLPKRNRCVIFFGGTRHSVEKVRTGIRKTVVMSVWDRIPFAHAQSVNAAANKPYPQAG